MNNKIIQKMVRKDSDKEKTAIEVMKDPETLSYLFEGLDSEKATAKYGSEKTLRFISEKKPELLYPYFDCFVKLLDSENKFLK